MAFRGDLVEPRLHVGIVENRTAHPYSQRISTHFHFSPAGFLALKHRFQERESVVLFARHFGPGLELRRNRPRVSPLVAPLAHLAMANLGMEPDVIVDESEPPYPPDLEFTLSEFESQGLPHLLRIERGRVRHREVFGPIRLHYGFFRLAARQASYLVARRPGAPREAVAGALGFLHDPVERNIRIFELIAASDQAIHFLFQSLLDRARALGVEYIEVDVSGHSPRLQRTLLALGFVPAAYMPAMVFHEVDRLDVVKMIHLSVPLPPKPPEMVESAEPIFQLVHTAIRREQALPALEREMEELALFHGLAKEQGQRLAGAMTVRNFSEGHQLFRAGEQAHDLFVLLSGRVQIEEPSGRELVVLDQGTTVGEVAMLTQAVHSASARAQTPLRTAVLTQEALDQLTALRPDVAILLYRNLARELGGKLKGADAAIPGLGRE